MSGRVIHASTRVYRRVTRIVNRRSVCMIYTIDNSPRCQLLLPNAETAERTVTESDLVNVRNALTQRTLELPNR